MINVRRFYKEDSRKIFELVKDEENLDSNSFYLYALLSNEFAESCLLSETEDGEITGFVTSFISPLDSKKLFVWQLFVKEEYRNNHIASKLLESLYRKFSPKIIEATIAPTNEASFNVFMNFAEKFYGTVEKELFLSREDFPEDSDHEDEVLVKIIFDK